MSKMSQLHAMLTQQATELGFMSIEEAEANGYEVDYEEQELVNPYVLCDKAHDEAHEAWPKERDEVLNGLISVYNDIDVPRDLKKNIKHAIDFIKKGEM